MKSLTITEEQKVKLLEMCKVFFPKDIFSFNNDFAEDGIIDRNFAGDNVPREKRLNWNEQGSHFHWFEFCMTHLSSKIFCSLHDFTGYDTADFAQECSDEWNNKLMSHVMFHYFNPTRVVDNYDDGKIVAWHPIDYLYTEFKKAAIS